MSFLPKSSFRFSGSWAAVVERAPAFLGSIYLVFLGAGFVLRPTAVWALIFYVGVLPLTLTVIARGGRIDWRDRNVWLGAVLILYSALTLAWGEDPNHRRTGTYAAGAVCTAMFALASLLVLREDAPSRLRRIGSVLIVAGGANAVLSITLFYALAHEPRLAGFAETRHSILGASVIGMVLVFALDRLMRDGHRLWLLPIAPCIAFIWLTGSRGPLLSIAAAAFVFFVHAGRRFQTVVVVAACAAGTILRLIPQSTLATAAPVMQRGQSYRLEIWSYTLGEVAKRPWFGHGLAARLDATGYEFPFPHSLYLSTLYFSGIVGLVLLLTLLGSLALGILRLYRDEVPERVFLAALWVHTVCSGLTDLGQVVKQPSSLWYILWLPLLVMTALIIWHRKDEIPGRRSLGTPP